MVGTFLKNESFLKIVILFKMQAKMYGGIPLLLLLFDWVYYEALNSNTTYKKPRQVISRFVIS